MPTPLEESHTTPCPLHLLGSDLQDQRKAGHGENFSFRDLDNICFVAQPQTSFFYIMKHHLLNSKARMTMWLKMHQMEDTPVMLRSARKH